MSRIRIYDSTCTTHLGTVQDVHTAARTERLNSDNVLTFTAPLSAALEPLIVGGNVAELDGDFFDIVYYRKGQDPDGSLRVDVECEHVSYRLNDSAYDLEFFTQTGTPAAILAELLDGTEFTIGTVEPTTSVTYSAQEKKSRRMLLMELVQTVSGEVDFDDFEISILTQRGSVTPVDLTATRDIEVVDKVYNAREKDMSGNPLVSYACSLIRPVAVALGDVVALDYPAIDVDVELRVVSITRNPYNQYECSFEIGNFVPGLADDAYRIETSTLAKGKTYYGARISPENGFESIRSDKMARTVMNADTFAMQTGDGSGSNWQNKLYFDAATGKYIFDGELSATLISALEAEFDVTVSNVTIVNNLTAQKGYIASLTVDELETSDMVQNFLDERTDDVNYIHAYNEVLAFITATTDGLTTVPVYNRNGEQLYWLDATHEGVTEDVTSYPVTIYDYEQLTKLKFYFAEIDGVKIPIAEWGAGNGVGNNGKAYQMKLPTGFVQKYIATGTGDVAAAGEVTLILGEDGAQARSPGAVVALRNIAHLAIDDELPDTLEDGDIVCQGFTVSDKREINAAATLTIQVDGLPQPTFIRFTGTTFSVALPTDAGREDGVELTFKNRASGTVTLTGTVDGATNYALTTGSFCHLRYNGTDWDRIG